MAAHIGGDAPIPGLTPGTEDRPDVHSHPLLPHGVFESRGYDGNGCASGASRMMFGSRKRSLTTLALGVAVIAVIAAVTLAVVLTSFGKSDDDDTDYRLAENILRSTPLIDGHNDLPWQIRNHWANNMSAFDLNDDLPQLMTDIPRLRKGMVGGQFWSVYIPCTITGGDAVQETVNQIDVVYEMAERYPDAFGLSTTAKGVQSAFKSGKVASLIGMEGGHSINSSLPTLRMFAKMGARYMTLTHTCNLPWADAASKDGPFPNNGLSPFGHEVVKEMNRLGMIVDISHVSPKTMKDALDTTQAPIIFSHSGAYNVCQNVRNVPDDVLDLLPANGGVVMVPFYPEFISNSGNATVEDVIDHIAYIVKRIGVDHVGIGADLDGIPETVPGLQDVSRYLPFTTALLERGFHPDEVKQIVGKNVLRVLEQVETISAKLRKTTQPSQAVCDATTCSGF